MDTKTFFRILAAFATALAFTAVTPAPVEGADHRDATAILTDPSANIADVWMFIPTPNPASISYVSVYRTGDNRVLQSTLDNNVDIFGTAVNITPIVPGLTRWGIGSVRRHETAGHYLVTLDGFGPSIAGFTQLFDAQGNLLRGPDEICVGAATDDYDELRAQAASLTDGTYLIGGVARPSFFNPDPTAVSDLFVIPYDSDGTPAQGTPIMQLGEGDPRPLDSGAFGGGGNRFLFAYPFDAGEGMIGLAAKPVNPDGTPGGPPQTIHTSAEFSFSINVAYNPAGDRFVVSWIRSGSAGQSDALRVLDSNGVPAFDLVNPGTTTLFNGALNVSPVPGSPYFLSAYNAQSDIFVRAHRPDGVPASNPVLINKIQDGHFVHTPRILTDPNTGHVLFSYVDFDLSTSVGTGRAEMFHLTEDPLPNLLSGSGDDVLLGSTPDDVLAIATGDGRNLLYSQNFGLPGQTLAQLGMFVGGPGLVSAVTADDPFRGPTDPRNQVLVTTSSGNDTLILTEPLDIPDLVFSFPTIGADFPLAGGPDVLINVDARVALDAAGVAQNTRIDAMLILDNGDDVIDPALDLVRTTSLQGDFVAGQWRGLDPLGGSDGIDFLLNSSEITDPLRKNLLVTLKLDGLVVAEFYLDNMVVTIRPVPGQNP
jgi:hypothetical protein